MYPAKSRQTESDEKETKVKVQDSDRLIATDKHRLEKAVSSDGFTLFPGAGMTRDKSAIWKLLL